MCFASCIHRNYPYGFEIEEMCLIRYLLNYGTVFSSNDTALFRLIIGILKKRSVNILLLDYMYTISLD